MSNRDADKKAASKSTPVSQNPGAELKDNELDRIAGGVAMAKPTTPRRKKPNLFISQEGP